MFPGGAPVGDDAGFLNALRIKGSHAAIKSGTLAAQAAFVQAGRQGDELAAYPDSFRRSWLHKELTFDWLSSVFLSNTNHTENQPAHLTLKDPSVPVDVNLSTYAGPEGRYCTAAVYEFVRRGRGPNYPKLQRAGLAARANSACSDISGSCVGRYFQRLNP
ncbi:hypothetical protein RM96_27060 [Cupriavidus sp. IDO]|nr:hypothetical protein RM96_27060 [Cupriavidus sp. IDO]